MIPAFAYARYSSENQNETSIESQLTEIRAYADRHGYKIIDTFIDRERSAAAAKQQRDEFLRMIREIRSGRPVKAVIVWNLSRYFRRASAAMQFEEELQALKINIVSVMQPLPVSEDGKPSADGLFMRRIQYLFDEKSSRDNSEHTTRNLLQHARAHQSHLGGVPPYGYKVILSDPSNLNSRRMLAPCPEEAENIDYIFRAVQAGKTYKTIVRELAARGAVTRRGGSFTGPAISAILTNPKYAGIYSYGRYAYNRISTGIKEKRDIPAVWVEDGCPALVDRALWEDVQSIIKSRHRQFNSHEDRNVYLLSGLAVCAICGGPVIGESKGTKRTPVYRCSGRKGLPHRWNIGTVGAEATVLGALWEKAFAGVTAEGIYAALKEDRKGIAVERAKRISNAVMDLTACQGRIDALVRSLADGVPAHLVKEELERLDEERKFLEDMIGRLKNGRDDEVSPVERIAEILDRQKKAMEESDVVTLREILIMSVESIEISPPADGNPEKMVIHWADGDSVEIRSFRLSTAEVAALGLNARRAKKGSKESDGAVNGGAGLKHISPRPKKRNRTGAQTEKMYVRLFYRHCSP
jgi:site-specific DNA recombinase